MNRGKFRITIVLMSLALIGLIALQAYWIRHDIKLKEQQFDQNVMSAMNAIVDQVEQKENMRIVVQQYITNGDSSAQKSAATTDSILESLSAAVGEPPLPPSPPDMPGLSSELVTRIRQLRAQHRKNSSFKDGKLAIDLDSTVDIRIEKDVHQKQIIGLNIVQETAAIDSMERETEMRVKSKIEKLNSMMQKLTFQIGERSDNVFDRINEKALDSIIKTELVNRDIDLPYSYGIAKKEHTGLLFSKVPADSSALKVSSYSLTLFPNDIFKRGEQLILTFKGRLNFLVISLWPMLLTSLILTSVMVFGFIYTIYIILNQKRLAEIKNDFINNMTHEFKTPIATIAIANESIRDPRVFQSREKMEYYSDVIRDENERMLRQVENVLQMAQIDKGELVLKKEALDIHDVLQQAIASALLSVEQREGIINSNLNATQFIVFGDGNHLLNVFINLLDNANKYSPEKPMITITTESNETFIQIRIKDRGIGMNKETQKRIFETFYRASTGNIHDVKGFGLGLSYVKAIIEKHDGSIAVHSEIGSGSTFIVSLPLNT